MTLRVVTDSSCDLPPALVQSLDLTVIPCNIHFGQDTYRDGLDMQSEEFYRRLSGDVFPTTSQPTIESFLEGYRSLAGQADQVLSLHLSSKLSTTVNTALLAREQMGGRLRVEVIDSLQVSLGLGVLALETARIAKEGGGLEEAIAFVEREKGRITSYFSVDTLDYLVKGGRASKAQGFLASLLSVKPILAVKDDGEVHPVERVRTRARVLERLVELVASSVPHRALGILHSIAPEDAQTLVDRSAAHVPREKIIVSQFSPVIGTHLGPRAVGVVLWTGS